MAPFEALRKYVKMDVLPGSEWFLYKMIRDTLHFTDMRECFICGILLMYHVWNDPKVRPILINVINEWRNQLGHEKRTYEPMAK